MKINVGEGSSNTFINFLKYKRFHACCDGDSVGTLCVKLKSKQENTKINYRRQRFLTESLGLLPICLVNSWTSCNIYFDEFSNIISSDIIFTPKVRL